MSCKRRSHALPLQLLVKCKGYNLSLLSDFKLADHAVEGTVHRIYYTTLQMEWKVGLFLHMQFFTMIFFMFYSFDFITYIHFLHIWIFSPHLFSFISTFIGTFSTCRSHGFILTSDYFLMINLLIVYVDFFTCRSHGFTLTSDYFHMINLLAS